jgi:rfaE bifunctional protein nucleotidyltransferase chain/domain
VLLTTPNLAELRTFSEDGTADRLSSGPLARSGPGQLGAVAAAAAELRQRWLARSVCVTLGERGAMLVEGDASPLLVPPVAAHAGDTCGAGDMFAATAAVALAGGDLPSEAVAAAVRAASAFVAAGGAAAIRVDVDPVDPADPQQEAESPTVESLLDAVRRANGVVVATGGCFDLLHPGHVATLEAARRLGDVLVVCLNGDESVRRLKGAGRPLQSATDRARVLAGLTAVDAVVVFDEDTPETVLRRLKPDLWVKGGDYTGMELPEHRVLAEWGAAAVTVPYLVGRSTSALVEAAGGTGAVVGER